MRLPGLDGSNPLGFLAALGVLRVLDEAAKLRHTPAPLLGWEGASWAPVLHRVGSLEVIATAVEHDARVWSDARRIRLAYPKLEKSGVKVFRGLKPSVAALSAWLAECLDEGDREVLDCAAALTAEPATELIPEAKRPQVADYFAVSCAFDPSAPLDLSTLPTAFDFTTRNTQFLDQVRLIGEIIDKDLLLAALTGDDSAGGRFAGRTMGWDPLAERPAALYSYGRQPNPALEWCAFRSLPFFPVFGKGGELHTTGCSGRRKEGTFTWALWEPPIGTKVVRSLLSYPGLGDVTGGTRTAMGLSRVFRVRLAKAADGYTGVFSPTRTS